MLPLRCALLCLALLIGAARAAGAQGLDEFPDPFRGTWYAGRNCDNVLSRVRLSGGSVTLATLARAQGDTTELLEEIPIEKRRAREIAVSGNGLRFVVGTVDKEKVGDKDKTGDKSKKGEKAAGRGFVSVLTDERTREERAEREPGRKLVTFRCDNPKAGGVDMPLHTLFFRFVDALEDSIYRLQTVCRGGAQGCADGLVDFLDFNGDRRISPAELTRVLRSLAKLAVYNDLETSPANEDVMTGTISAEQILGVQVAAATVAPLVSRLIMENLDYDGDGFLSKEELASVSDVNFPASASAELNSPEFSRRLTMYKNAVGHFLPTLTELFR
jgi:hypothetical protein